MAKIEIKTTLKDGTPLNLDKSWISSFESNSESTDTPSELTYGAIPNTGTLTLKDKRGQLRNYIEQGLIDNSSLPIDIYLNGKLAQTHIGEASDYNLSSYELSINLKGIVESLENMTYSGYKYEGRATSLVAILRSILLEAGFDLNEIHEMLSEKYFFIDDRFNITVEDFLTAVQIDYPHLESSSVKEAIDKVCQVAQLYCYEKPNGKLTFSQARPINSNNKDVIILQAGDCYSDFSKSLILKNKYNGVKANVKRYTEKIEKDTQVASFENYVSNSLSMISKEGEGTGIHGSMAGGHSADITGNIKATYWNIKLNISPYQDLTIINDIYSGVDADGNSYITVSKFDSIGENITSSLALSDKDDGKGKVWIIKNFYPKYFQSSKEVSLQFELEKETFEDSSVIHYDQNTNSWNISFKVLTGYILNYSINEKGYHINGDVAFNKNWSGSEIVLCNYLNLSFRGYQTTAEESEVKKIYK